MFEGASRVVGKSFAARVEHKERDVLVFDARNPSPEKTIGASLIAGIKEHSSPSTDDSLLSSSTPGLPLPDGSVTPPLIVASVDCDVAIKQQTDKTKRMKPDFHFMLRSEDRE